MLTARGEVVDRVVGLELGADDYLAKPFALRELLARVRALMRRAQGAPAAEPDEVTVGRVCFDLRGMTARGPAGTLDLTPHDLLVFKVLALRRGEVVPRVDIVEEVCGLESEATLRKVDNHVMALRRALGDDPRHPRWIHTVRGHGYRLARADAD
jgi:DNA-binding response OmpR family regulator